MFSFLKKFFINFDPVVIEVSNKISAANLLVMSHSATDKFVIYMLKENGHKFSEIIVRFCYNDPNAHSKCNLVS